MFLKSNTELCWCFLIQKGEGLRSIFWCCFLWWLGTLSRTSFFLLSSPLWNFLCFQINLTHSRHHCQAYNLRGFTGIVSHSHFTSLALPYPKNTQEKLCANQISTSSNSHFTNIPMQLDSSHTAALFFGSYFFWCSIFFSGETSANVVRTDSRDNQHETDLFWMFLLLSSLTFCRWLIIFCAGHRVILAHQWRAGTSFFSHFSLRICEAQHVFLAVSAAMPHIVVYRFNTALSWFSVCLCLRILTNWRLLLLVFLALCVEKRLASSRKVHPIYSTNHTIFFLQCIIIAQQSWKSHHSITTN